MPPQLIPLSEIRLAYTVISTLVHPSVCCGSWMYMRGTEPDTLSCPVPSTLYEALPWSASNQGSFGSTPEKFRETPLSQVEVHSFPPVGYSSLIPKRSF